MEGELLLSVFALLPDEVDRFYLSQSALADSNDRSRLQKAAAGLPVVSRAGEQRLECVLKCHVPGQLFGEGAFPIRFDTDTYPIDQPDKEPRAGVPKLFQKPN